MNHVDTPSPWFGRRDRSTVEKADDLLASLERLELEASRRLATLSDRGEDAWQSRLERMRLDALLHQHQLRRARERLARELGRDKPPQPREKPLEITGDSTEEVLLCLTRRASEAYETVLLRLVGPAALRGMVTSCLTDHRIHRREIEERVAATDGEVMESLARGFPS